MTLIKIKKIYLIIFLLLTAFFSTAQQVGMISHSYYKPMVYNPAFTGIGDATNVFLISRSQWVDFKNSPQLNIATIDGSLMGKKVGVGFGLITDRKGLSNRIGGNISYAYNLTINDNTHLRFGISIGVIDQTYDYSKAIVENPSDPALFNTVQRTTSFDGAAGIALVWKGMEIGAAVPQIIGNKIKYVDNTDIRSYYSQTRHYIGSLKYKIIISEDKGLSISPLALIHFLPNTPFQFDGNLNFDWNDKFWLGATYKSNYAVSANVGFRIHKQLYVGYSYDFIIGNIGKYSGMAHEIMLNFKFGKKEKMTLTGKENKIYENSVDELQNQVKQNKEKIKELTEKLGKQTQQQKPTEIIIPTLQNEVTPTQVTPTHDNDNQNAEVVADNLKKTQKDGIWILTNRTKDFKDAQNHEPQKGFYVIVGTFYYRDLAIGETKRLVGKGYNADWVFYSTKGFNYVYTDRALSKEEAVKKAKQFQMTGIQDAWIQELIK